METMLRRSGKNALAKDQGTGPGKLARLLGIHFSHSGMDLTKRPAGLSDEGIWLEDHGITVLQEDILTGPRIGVGYAGKDALLPYRFRIRL